MKFNNYFIVLCAFMLFAPSAATAREAIGIELQNDKEIVTISVPATSGNKVFTLANPDRLVVDVPATTKKPDQKLPSSYDGSLFNAVRIGQFSPQTTRFVFDLARPAKVEQVQETSQGLEITLGGGTSKKANKGKKSSASYKRSAPSKPVIIIDAGHGGVDPGTIGSGGTQEKDVVLSYARLLQQKLQKTGKYEAQLTRAGDYFIMLRKRIDIARKQGATIFISLHADSAPAKQARGLSVYTVSEQSSDKEAEDLAARENKADILGGMDLSNEREDVAEILISLAQRETMNRSAALADVLVDALEDRVDMLPNAHRFAGFAVLKAPDVPSVLIETGFLSNSKEEKLLKSKVYREKVTTGIVEGIDAYFKLVGDEQQ